MRRPKRMPRSKSRKYFTNTAQKVSKINGRSRPKRGGYRL